MLAPLRAPIAGQSKISELPLKKQVFDSIIFASDPTTGVANYPKSGYYDGMRNTPNITTQTTLPVTVRDLREASRLCRTYDSVLTVGPSEYEVRDFGHHDHKIISFSDTVSVRHGGPTLAQITEAIEWGSTRTNVLVHCHAGISRSTATAWGICVAHGYDPKEAFDRLKDAHPSEYGFPRVNGKQMSLMHKRPFAPNRLIVTHLQTIFGYQNDEMLSLITSPDWYGKVEAE